MYVGKKFNIVCAGSTVLESLKFAENIRFHMKKHSWSDWTINLCYSLCSPVRTIQLLNKIETSTFQNIAYEDVE